MEQNNVNKVSVNDKLTYNEKTIKSRKVKDIITNSFTYLSSAITLLILIGLIVYIFVTGSKTLSFKMLVSDYYETSYYGSVETTKDSQSYSFPNESGTYYSSVWGIGLTDSTNLAGEEVVKISYVDNLSPLKNITLTDNQGTLEVEEGYALYRVQLVKEDGSLSLITRKSGAEAIALSLDQGYKINEIYIMSSGGGIRGSLITTLYLILLTLIIALPVGVFSAIYLSLYAKDNKITRLLRTLIDMISGVPSIIFGLMAVIVFIPFVNNISGSSGGTIMSGALTMSVMLLPTIIRTTEEAINVIPKSYMQASLALGASKTESVFKVIIPNAMSGILTATILSIGKIIGESAALIFAIGTAIQDKVSINAGSTTLAVHIWTLLSGDEPNYSAACAISIVILIVVLILNLLVKLVSKKLNKFEVK